MVRNIVETTNSVGRGMNPVAMAIITSRKEYGPSKGSNKRTPVGNATDLAMGLSFSVDVQFYTICMTRYPSDLTICRLEIVDEDYAFLSSHLEMEIFIS